VTTHSQPEAETQQADTQITNVAQAMAVAATVHESWLFPVIATSADESNSSSNSSSDEVPVTDGPTGSDGPTGPDGIPITGEPSTDDLDGDGCSDSYAGACVDPYTGTDDVNCADVTETGFDSIGDDPYRLDSDGDGIACESSV
jgi:hypothetical protein